jgi:MFS family permease
VIHGGGRFANALAPVIATALIVQLTWRVAFVALGLITILFFVFLYRWFRDEPREHPAITASELAVLSPGQSAGGRTSEPIVWLDLLRRVWPASATCFAHRVVLYPSRSILGWCRGMRGRDRRFLKIDSAATSPAALVKDHHGSMETQAHVLECTR